jgi:hypothetical protein
MKWQFRRLRRLTWLRNEFFKIIKIGGKFEFFYVLLISMFVFGLLMNVGYFNILLDWAG